MAKYLSSDQIWKENAENFKAGAESPVVYREVPSVRSFLGTGNADDRFVLMGAKGMGKSMLLREKAHLYTNVDGLHNINMRISNDYNKGRNLSRGTIVENISIQQSEKYTDILNITTASEWSDIWAFAIYSIVLLRVGKKWPRPVSDLLGGITDLSGVISRIIRYSSDIGEYVKHTDTLGGMVKDEVQSLAVLYIDCLDNCLSGMLRGMMPKQYKKRELPPSVKVWTNCQIGAMMAVHSINQRTPHLKVGIAVRSEILPHIEDHNRANILAISAELDFTPTDLRRMFIQKIKLTNPSELVLPHAADPFERFLGFREIEHSIVLSGGIEEMEVEDVFDYFLRHTFGRPRELTSIGNALSQLVQREEYRLVGLPKKKKMIRKTVNKTANKLLDNYLKEIIPYFAKEQLKDLVRQLSHNVFTLEESRRLDQSLLKYYFNLGLIGFVERDIDQPNGKLIQRFEEPAVNSYMEQQDLPETTHFLVHPCLDRMFIKIKNHRRWYPPYNIVGHERPFIIPTISHQTKNDWKPRDVSGGRMHKVHDKHVQPLKVYYEGLFNNPQIIDLHLVDNFGVNFDKRFSILLNFYALRWHEKQADTTLDERAEKLMEQARESGIIREHTAKLGFCDFLSLYTFFERIVNRSLLLAAHLLLNVPNHVTANFFKTADFNPDCYQPPNRKEHSFLQNAFFVSNLSARDQPDELANLQAKIKVWRDLSRVEQFQLKKVADELPVLLEGIDFLSVNSRQRLLREIDRNWLPKI